MSERNVTRSEQIRKGNELYNALKEKWSFQRLKKVSLLFSSANYQDGLFRLADFLTYDKKMPLLALSYYKQINNSKAKERIREINQRMFSALKFLLKQK